MSVHFSAVCEWFTPHDSTFSITTSDELRDSKLSAACSLHAATGSTSSSTSSIRRRRLGEIAEEDEEEQQRASKRQSVGDLKAEEPEAKSSGLDTSPPPPRDPPVTLNADLAASPEAGTFTTATDPPDFTGASPTSPRKSSDTTGRRLSSHSARTDFYYPYGRQRVKLGPRPSTDTTGRPRTSSSNPKAVSTVPAGFKLFSKGSRKGKPDAADDDSIAESQVDLPDLTFAAPDRPISTEPLSPGLERPHTSSGASFTMLGSKGGAKEKEKITPEKARLMKAMQLREKKKRMSMLPPPSPSEAGFASEGGEGKEEPKPVDDAPAEGAKDNSTEEARIHLAPEDAVIPDSTADSAIAMEVSAINDQASDATQSDSHPASPFIASSEAEQSTKASSLSESTDETVQGRDSVVKDDVTVEARDSVVKDEEPVEVNDEAPAETDASTHEPGTVEVEKPADAPTDVDEAPAVLPATAEDVPSEVKDGSDEKLEPEVEATEELQPAPKASTAPDTVEEFQTLENTVSELASPESDTMPESKAVEETKAPLRIPKSKFSTPDLRVVANDQEPPVPAIPTEEGPHGRNGGEAEKVVDNNTQGSRDADIAPADTKADKHATQLNPIRTDLTVPSARSSQHLSVDDELLDELQSAVVEEAKPIAVSPLSPVFPPIAGAKEGSGAASSNRAVSQPTKPTLLSPTDIPLPTGRSSSSGTTFLNRLSQQGSNAPVPKKTSMGSTISQRIKALEKLSGSEGGEPRPAAPTARLFTTTKTSRPPSRSPSLVERASSFTKSSSPSGLGEGSPETLRLPTRDRSGSLKNRLSMFEPGVSPPRGRTESVQVKAKIVRDRSGRRDSTGPLDLKQSPLVVDHQRSEPAGESTPPPPPKETLERRMSNQTGQSESHDGDDSERKRRSSLNFMRDFIKDRRTSLTSPSVDSLMSAAPISPSHSPSRPPSTHQSSSLTRRLSISSRRSSVSRDAAPMPAMSPSAFTETSGSGDDAKSEKRSGSRTGRFMRRLSSSLSAGRSKSTPTGISPTLHEEVSSEAVGPPRVAAFMGDVNVQFPDNLLWKRRCMCLDEQGFVVLSAAATAGSRAGAGAGVKRYHLSEFRAPYAPEMEVQELPNSVCLDFVEGSGLQVACEDRAGQTSVLQSEFLPSRVACMCVCGCVLTDGLQLSWTLTRATHPSGNNLADSTSFSSFTAAISLFYQLQL